MAAFVDGLRDLGYVDGETIAIDYRGAEGRVERHPALAADLVGRQIDILVSTGASASAVAARDATRTIPIVFMGVGDPVGLGLIASFARPGANMTGTSLASEDLAQKRLQLLKELLPRATRVDFAVNSGVASAPAELALAQDAARQLGLTLQPRDVRDVGDLEAAFVAMAGARPDAIVTVADGSINAMRDRFLELATAMHVPVIANHRDFMAPGCLMTFGPNVADTFRRAAVHVDRILKGDNPAELPVERPTKFDLIANLKTVEALGLTISSSVLQQATEVIQ